MSAKKSEISLENIQNYKRTRKRVDYNDKLDNNKNDNNTNNDNDSDFEPPKHKSKSSQLRILKRDSNIKNKNSQSENDTDENVPLKLLSKKLSVCSRKSRTRASRPNLSEDESSDSDNEEITFKSLPESFLNNPFGETRYNNEKTQSPQEIPVKNLSALESDTTIREDNVQRQQVSSVGQPSPLHENMKEHKLLSEKKISKRKSDSKLNAPDNKRQKTIKVKRKNRDEEFKKREKKKPKKFVASKEPKIVMTEFLQNVDVGFSSDEASGSDWEDVNGNCIFFLLNSHRFFSIAFLKFQNN